MKANLETAVFGGGCFWCTEAIFQRLKGVMSVTPGYSGGDLPNPTYEQVSSSSSGHTESIKIEFDPSRIAFRDLLAVFFSTHDPTTMDRQGHDIGKQYRSVIFYADEKQKNQAQDFIRQLENQQIFASAVVTQLKPLTNFYPAEDYHQNYYNNNPDQPYCQVVINSKLEKLKKQYAGLLKK